MLASAYKQYLYLPRPVSRRHPMDVGRRAKQFAPFAALRGMDETIRQQEIIYEPKKELSDDQKQKLDMKLRMISYGMRIQATYFAKKQDNQIMGKYHTVTGKVEFFNPAIYLRIDNTAIPIKDICDLSGDVFEELELPC